MKSISLAFDASTLNIPFSYHHQVQGLIYGLLDGGGGGLMHDQSIDSGKRQYKLFTFSSLRGGKVSQDRKALLFDRSVFLDVRSVRSEFCDALLDGLDKSKSFYLFGQHLNLRSVEVKEAPIKQSELRIKMLSPLTVHRTNENHFTHYFSPLDPDFGEEIHRNFARKYHAFTGEMPTSGITITASAVSSKDKYVTLYKKADSTGGKDIYITGWRGEYELKGRPDYLTFLYYCGLGARNSDGFGMFELL